MSREILFKAKRINNGEWVERYIFKLKTTSKEYKVKDRYFIFTGEFDVTGLFPDFIRYEVDPSTICQCAGLTDKNNKKIWENDIVKTYEASSKEYLTNIVKYYKGSFKVFKKHYLSMYISKYELKDLEVIGNVFDNPELLEGGVL